ncbi:MTAP [Mytilus edulis]|uniref:S-methyl-5'-thioadenosine phosphorylase n=1 Tax=Mytilus edulis TaxID=6550 RepID=A0A8S3VNH5_MYTED|nr:MTAP [Mytilus edulis]
MGTKVKIGIIGGSGLSKPDILKGGEEKEVNTPFGKPSDALICGEIEGVPCVLLSRHGRGHTIMPTNVNFRANIWAMKELGCTHLLVTTACGSLQEGMHPGDIVVIDQFIDRTQKRIQTFFDGAPLSPLGICHMSMADPFCSRTSKVRTLFDGAPLSPLGICHMSMADPFCSRTSKMLYESGKNLGLSIRETGTMLTIEGPRFSSRAESKLFNSWGAHCINMTTVPEVILAKEVGLCYAALALVTDYDSWREGEEGVNVENVMKIFKQNSSNALKVLLDVIPKIAKEDWTKTLEDYKNAVTMNTLLPHSY